MHAVCNLQVLQEACELSDSYTCGGLPYLLALSLSVIWCMLFSIFQLCAGKLPAGAAQYQRLPD